MSIQEKERVQIKKETAKTTSDAKKESRDSLLFRVPMKVTAVLAFSQSPGLYTYPICPQCGRTIDREYQAFCDRCGQALCWKGFSKAKIIIAGKVKEERIQAIRNL